MAVPKKKVGRSRRDIRRYAGGNKLATPTGAPCSNCGEIRRPHRVCKCGFYDGKAVLPAQTSREN